MLRRLRRGYAVLGVWPDERRNGRVVAREGRIRSNEHARLARLSVRVARGPEPSLSRAGSSGVNLTAFRHFYPG